MYPTNDGLMDASRPSEAHLAEPHKRRPESASIFQRPTILDFHRPNLRSYVDRPRSGFDRRPASSHCPTILRSQHIVMEIATDIFLTNSYDSPSSRGFFSRRVTAASLSNPSRWQSAQWKRPSLLQQVRANGFWPRIPCRPLRSCSRYTTRRWRLCLYTKSLTRSMSFGVSWLERHVRQLLSRIKGPPEKAHINSYRSLLRSFPPSAADCGQEGPQSRSPEMRLASRNLSGQKLYWTFNCSKSVPGFGSFMLAFDRCWKRNPA